MKQKNDLDNCTYTGDDIGKPQNMTPDTPAEPELEDEEETYLEERADDIAIDENGLAFIPIDKHNIEIAKLKAELAEANENLKEYIPKAKVQEAKRYSPTIDTQYDCPDMKEDKEGDWISRKELLSEQGEEEMTLKRCIVCGTMKNISKGKTKCLRCMNRKDKLLSEHIQKPKVSEPHAAAYGKGKRMKCKQCAYEWVPNKEKPKCCPRCKRYDYEQGKVK